MKHLYLFSGLGADHRAFARMDFGEYNVTHVRWERPAKGETLAAYAGRLAVQVTEPNPVFIGLSFGGIVAGEVAKIVQTDQLLLLASVKRADELPPYYRWASTLPLHKLLPSRLLLTPNFLADWLFGVKTREDRKLLADILRDTDLVFLRWAMNVVVNWRGENTHPRLRHIHGTADRILPYRYTRPDFAIAGGGHLMTLTMAQEVSTILQQLLAQS